jgi:hypothetical protein
MIRREIVDEDVDRIELAQGMILWGTFVNTVIEIQVSLKQGILDHWNNTFPRKTLYHGLSFHRNEIKI